MARRYRLSRTTTISAPRSEVFDFFSRPGNLARITPPSLAFRITSGPDRPLQQDDRISYSIRVAAIPMTWRTHITEWNPPFSFVDDQERGPYKLWRHLHTFTEVGGGVKMDDHVEYELPFGFFGDLFGAGSCDDRLKRYLIIGRR
jgi:ligand-binding SRPBCC domain-containing protein